MIERFRNVLIRATVGGLAFSAIAVSGATAEEAKGQAQAEFVNAAHSPATLRQVSAWSWVRRKR
ncbi:hypothetical protein [Sinorhizobium meliloti]|uniref:hypothetical protein n=1 Tax=Rhizobium meliloti TaxID=382 RepID=UPI00398CBE98